LASFLEDHAILMDTTAQISGIRIHFGLVFPFFGLTCTCDGHVHWSKQMAVATERIVVQVTPTQKKAISSAAKRLGLNVSELMRQAAQGFQPKSDEGDIDALIERVNASTKEANEALDDALAFVRESNKRIDAMNKASH
jgi:hypothetical protein